LNIFPANWEKRKNMQPQNVQQQLFTLIEQKIQPRKLSAELGDLLSIAPSAVYRRLSGETLISFEQLLLLIKHYDIPFGQLTDPLAISFELPTLLTPPKKLMEFLTFLEKDLVELKRDSASKIRFAALEVPLFYYLMFPQLAAFKFFMWRRTLWQSKNPALTKFSFSEYTNDSPLQMQIKNMVDLYSTIDGEEVWNSNMFDITLNQMRYCLSAGLFQDPNDVKILIQNSKDLIAHFEMMAIKGKKTTDKDAASIKVWYNELFQNGMFILTETSSKSLIYNAFDVPNFMVSSNSEMYKVGLNFFNRMSSFSLDIMGANEVNRHQFFGRLSRKIDIFEKESLV
jgi:hypothetical protein